MEKAKGGQPPNNRSGDATRQRNNRPTGSSSPPYPGNALKVRREKNSFPGRWGVRSSWGASRPRNPGAHHDRAQRGRPPIFLGIGLVDRGFATAPRQFEDAEQHISVRNFGCRLLSVASESGIRKTSSRRQPPTRPTDTLPRNTQKRNIERRSTEGDVLQQADLELHERIVAVAASL
jgi:hypothetical protein